jgi:cold shock CspA family protein
MARPASMAKRDNEKKKQAKRLEKQKRKAERQSNKSKGASLEDMFAYVDENGQITSTPPELQTKSEISAEDIAVSVPKRDTSTEALQLTGRVDKFFTEKGYGFIKEKESGVNYFFHITSAPENIAEGQVVFFELERGQKDMNAVKIRIKE